MLLHKNTHKGIEIGPEVDTDRISGDGVVIHTGCKLYGSSTLILRDAKLRYEGPVTIENCQVGARVELKAGFFRNAVFYRNQPQDCGPHQ